MYKIPTMEEIKQISWNGYNAISTFSGMGGSCLGFRMAGFRVGAALEFIPEAAKTYRINHPDTALIEADIRDISGKDLLNKAGLHAGEVHVLEGSPPCLIPNQDIITSKGYKHIEDVKENDFVYTHKGSYKSVIKTMSREYEGDIYNITVNGYGIPIQLTPEHPLYVYKGKMKDRGEQKFEWVKAQEITDKDMVVYTINDEDKGNFCDINKAEFLGYYIMCGIIDVRDRVCFNTEGKAMIANNIIKCCKKAFGMEPEEYMFSNKKHLALPCEKAVQLCKTLGNKSGKMIPEELINSKEDFLREFAKAILECDKGKGDMYFRPSSSIELLMGIQRILLKLNCFSNIYKCSSKKSEEGFTYYAIIINKKEQDKIGTAGDTWFRKENTVFLKVEKIEKVSYKGLVYNLEVEEDNSYCNHIITTHNCSDFSSQRNASTKEVGKFKTYSSTKQRVDDLFLEYIRILKDIQPWVFIAENVESLLDEDKQNYLNDFMAEFSKTGYETRVKKIDFSDYGVPQARKRAIFIGIAKDLVEKYGVLPSFPNPTGEIYTTKDAIEDLIDSMPDMEATELEKKYFRLIPVGAGTDYIRMLRDKYGLKIMQFNHRRDTWSRPHPTLVQNTRHVHPLRNRWLTVAEAKRLHSIPDDFILTGSTTDQYERIGRSVPPMGMYHIAKHIQENILNEIIRARPVSWID